MKQGGAQRPEEWGRAAAGALAAAARCGDLSRRGLPAVTHPVLAACSRLRYMTGLHNDSSETILQNRIFSKFYF